MRLIKKLSSTNTPAGQSYFSAAGMAPLSSMDSWWWHFLERLYALPEPPPRKRTKPMQVICVGFPRTGTESLQRALLQLGYDYTFHGWDIVYSDHLNSPAWVRLARKKWLGSSDGESGISAADFDKIIGHCVAVTDAAASCFAVEMIAAYPDAKVVLNVRNDLAAWHQSIQKTLVYANENWVFYMMSWFNRDCFWAWHVYERFLWPLLFRAPDGEMATAIRRNGKWIYREHSNMIRGLVPRDNLLEWAPDDGWAPLCEFLGKPVPASEFPHANAASGGWKSREKQCLDIWAKGAAVNFLSLFAILVCVLSYIYHTHY